MVFGLGQGPHAPLNGVALVLNRLWRQWPSMFSDKVQIDGEPYLVIESNFRKPGKGNAIYTLRMKNLVRGTVLERNYKGGESIEAADVEETEGQFLYRQGENYVFMDTTNYEQYELSSEQLGDAWKYLKDGTLCQMILFESNPITITPPNHVVLKVEYCEPGAK